MSEPVQRLTVSKSVPTCLGTLLPGWAGGREGNAELAGGGPRVWCEGRCCSDTRERCRSGSRERGAGAAGVSAPGGGQQSQPDAVLSAVDNAGDVLRKCAKPFLRVWLTFPSI